MNYVLVIDDEKAVLEAISGYLEILGWEVSVTTSGSEAISMIEKDPPKLIISDISMPAMDGIDLVGRLRKKTPDIPILVMSGNPVGTLFLDSARMLGARRTLTKPFSYEEFKNAVRDALADPRDVKD